MGDIFIYLDFPAQLRECVLHYLDMQETTPSRDLGSIPRDDFHDLMDAFKVYNPADHDSAVAAGENPPSGVPPTAGQRAKLVLLGRIARLATQVEWLPSELAAEEAANKQWELQMSQSRAEIEKERAEVAKERSSASGNISAASPSKLDRTIKLNSVTSQVSEQEVVPYSDAEIVGFYTVYRNKIGDEPAESEDPTKDQISAVGRILDALGIPDVDLAVFGPYSNRWAKKHKLAGLFLSADCSGSLVKREIFGPETFQVWEKSITVLFVIFIMKQACEPSTYQGYIKHVRKLHETFGTESWPLLYQCESRLRSEQFERIKRIGIAMYDQALDKSRSEYDPAKPMEFILKYAISEKCSFWREEFERPALLIVSRAKRPGEFVDGDAAINDKRLKPTQPAHAPPGATLAPPQPVAPVVKQRPPPQQRTHSVVNGCFIVNRAGQPLCEDFNAGACTQASNNGWCSVHWGKRHQCNKCLSPDHGTCDKTPTPPKGMTNAWSKGSKKGKGGKKGKGKGAGY